MGAKDFAPDHARIDYERDALAHIDIDDHACRILASATSAAEEILNRRALMDARGMSETPLFVFMGEHHDHTAHHLHHMQVLHNVSAHEPHCMMTFEKPHNYLQAHFGQCGQCHSMGAALLPEALAEQDRPHGHASLAASMGSGMIEQSDHARKALMRQCLDYGVPARFVDMVKPDGYLDHSDTSTAASIKACLGDRAPEKISSVGARGLYCRNHHILTCAAEAAEQSNARIILSQVGNAHVAGMGARRHAHYSLSMLCNQFFGPQAWLAMPIAVPGRFLGFGDKNLRQAKKLTGAPDNFKTCHDVPDVSADYTGKVPWIARWMNDFNTRSEEAAYVNAILQHPRWAAEGLDRFALGIQQHHQACANYYGYLRKRLYSPGCDGTQAPCC